MTLPAVERLLVSRERLRLALQGGAPQPPGSTDPGQPPRPVADLALSALRLAWLGHPWRALAGVLRDAATLLLAPQAARHPLRLLAVAAVAGALMVALRPWRWLGRPMVLATVGSLLRKGAAALLAAGAAAQMVRPAVDDRR